MDYMSLELWKEQNQSEQSAKMPPFMFEEQRRQSYGSGLALCAPEQDIRNAANMPLPFPDPSLVACAPRKGGLFSLSQWQELEVQLLIFKYMAAGIPVPPDLILLVQRSLPDKLAFQRHLYQQNQRYQPGGYWGREGVDSEPGRCRRTDGKKWRCSKDVVPGKKYCERHMHRGRNRSRKLVEDPTPTSAPAAADFNKTTTSPAPPSGLSKCSTLISLSGPSSSSDLLDLSSMPESSENELLFDETFDANASGKVLRRFFEDSPSSCSNPALTSPHTAHLSMASSGNTSSEFSLKLATDNNEMVPGIENIATRNARWNGWSNNFEASTGSPLAEALRASALTSPTSVLLKSNRSLSETSSFSG
ncbi:hypothetical protein H6P81_015196 [Aristolochia fimbriata]|uniref:Growth-regulating factor n=1 Tax=Aristolochia fimbriata TaxID=158543 RepID=A0AAV7E628_ARIFI|nr:hypothetical protein H6P81_015196 [Aristolochia fimbriata]